MQVRGVQLLFKKKKNMKTISTKRSGDYCVIAGRNTFHQSVCNYLSIKAKKLKLQMGVAKNAIRPRAIT